MLDQVVADIEHVAPNHRFPPITLRQAAMVCTLSGSATYTLDGEQGVYATHSLVIHAPGQSLQETAGPNGWSVGFVVFGGDIADQISALPRTLLQLQIHPDRCMEMSKLVANFHAQGEKSWALLSQIAAWLDLATRQEPHSTLADSVREILVRWPAGFPMVTNIASELGWSPRMLTYRFRQLYGMPVATWVRQQRVRDGQKLLQSGFTVTQASERLGFANPFHFSRMYKSVFGYPPSQDRELRQLLSTPLLDRARL